MTTTSFIYQRGLDGPLAGPNRSSTRRVAVIGAGACGICAAKYLLEAGFDVTVFEIGGQIGGMWCYMNDNGRSSAYRTLHINTSRGVTRFSDLDFDAATQVFPDHADMHRYLVAYAQHFDVTPHIRFHSRVTQLRPAFERESESPRWEVQLATGGSEVFDSVIVASGHLTQPLDMPEFKAFGGEYVHAHNYKTPEPYVGKRICVVGVGNSACDIASDLCVTAPRCVLVARSGVLILPKLMFGRAFTDITARIQRPWIPRNLRRRITRLLTWLAHGDLTRLGLKRPEILSHVTSNATVVTDIAYRRSGRACSSWGSSNRYSAQHGVRTPGPLAARDPAGQRPVARHGRDAPGNRRAIRLVRFSVPTVDTPFDRRGACALPDRFEANLEAHGEAARGRAAV